MLDFFLIFKTTSLYKNKNECQDINRSLTRRQYKFFARYTELRTPVGVTETDYTAGKRQM